MLTGAELEALGLSLRVSLVASLGALPLALALALLLARRRFPGRVLVDTLVHLPLVLPPVVTGWLLLIIFGARTPIGAWLESTFGIVFVFSWTGAALAAAVVGLPFQVRAIRLALEAADPGLLAAAATLGAGPLDRFLTITLPLALPGLAAALVTGFAVALGEFGAVITFAANVPGETRTLPLAIYTALQQPGGEAAAARLAGLSIGLALAALLVAGLLVRRR